MATLNALKSLARDALAQVLLTLGVSAPSRRCRGKLLILTFHRVLPEELRRRYPLPGLAVTPEELRWILSELLPYFETHTVTDAIHRLRQEEPKVPLLAVSFDDGQWDNLAYAAPVLQSLNVRATFYVPTDYIGAPELLWHDKAAFAWQESSGAVKRDVLQGAATTARLAESSNVATFLEGLKTLEPAKREALVAALWSAKKADELDWARLMSWSEIAELQRMGHEIGSHGCSHALLPQLDAEGQRRELAGSMQAIAEAVGRRPTSMCYPNGSYDARTTELARELGYENAVTTQWGVNDRARPAFEFLRCDMDARRLLSSDGRLSAARMALRLSGLQPGL